MNPATLNNHSKLLHQLRDIHQPPPISWWPPAPGWWILAAIMLCLLAAALLLGLRQRRQQRARRQALQELNRLSQQQGTCADNEILSKLSTLLRRTAMAYYPRSQIAALHGETWLLFLDKTGKMNEFSQGIGRQFLTAPYQANPNIALPELITLTHNWLKNFRSGIDTTQTHTEVND